jgi:hypothetical protein
MRLNVTFRCLLPTDKSAHPIGEELANYLRPKLDGAGIPISEVDNFNDIGWCLDTAIGDKKLFISIAYIGKGDFEWLLQINNYTTSVWNIFHKGYALPEREQLPPVIHSVLVSDPIFSTIRWHAGAFYKGNYSPTPDGD